MPDDPDPSASIGVIATDRPVLQSLWWRTCGHLALRPVLERPEVHDNSIALTLIDLDTREPSLGLDHATTGPLVLLLGRDLAAGAPALRDERVRGVVTLMDDTKEFEQVVRDVAVGTSRISAAATPIVLALLRQRTEVDTRTLEPLTPREADVIRAMLDGHTIKSTSRALGIARKTVEAHRSRAFRKLGARSQSEAVATSLADPRILDGHHR